jgi:acyl-CoA thioesterase-1
MMIGDCTLATTYLPDKLKNERVLQTMLHTHYPHDGCTVTNEGLDGETVAHFLKRYERTFQRNAPPHYVFIRYGVNDRKAYGVDGFRQRLTELCDRLLSDFPNIRLLLETGMYVDYPAHYEFDRNPILQPIYDVIRDVGQSYRVPVVDIFERMKQETEHGNWDLRVRGYGVVDDEIPVLGAGQDHLHIGDVRWWTNIHPNPRGIAVIANEELHVLQHHWPTTLRY